MFPVQLTHEQDWQPYPVDPYSCYMCDHTMSVYSSITVGFSPKLYCLSYVITTLGNPYYEEFLSSQPMFHPPPKPYFDCSEGLAAFRLFVLISRETMGDL